MQCKGLLSKSGPFIFEPWEEFEDVDLSWDDYKHEFITAVRWCAEHFGAGGRQRERRWLRSNMTIEILSPDDALAFKLRWC
jgi:hypothetical protein